MLEAGAGDLFPPLVDAVRVEPGYETALGAALGDDLVAPIDTAAPLHWATLPPLAESPALPEGAVPLERFGSEEHTSELQSLMRISYAVFCLKKKRKIHITHT